MDPDLGIVVVPEEVPEDIYPFCLVDESQRKTDDEAASKINR